MILLGKVSSTISSKKILVKRFFCIRINLFLMRIYEKFRGCSEVKEKSDLILQEYKDNAEKVEIINTNMPKLVKEVDRIRSRNTYLEARVVHTFNELIEINNFAINGDCDSIITLLNKYNLSKKLEY